MPTVTIALNGRNYDVACGEGEQERVQELAGEIRRRMEGLTRNAGTAMSEGTAFVMTALLLADELDQRKRETSKLKDEGRESSLRRELALADTIEALAKRIETLAARVEAA
ncbi:MAG TPA: cell division protein ZapA [Candidatus Cybelea sp.]|nr:cell division protein ZapA [Candidatus Cybelea sp.]